VHGIVQLGSSASRTVQRPFLTLLAARLIWQAFG
jgi:hypothetical protein